MSRRDVLLALTLGLGVAMLAETVLAAGPNDAPTLRAPISADEAALFENRVRPLLAKHCWACHGAKKQEASLRLDSAESVARGSDNGAVVIAGQPDKSLLVAAVLYEGDIKMPPAGKLPQMEIDVLVTWVKSGAPWPREPKAPQSAGPQQADPQSLWSLKPAVEPPLPGVSDGAWPLTAVDYYILQKLEARGLTPAPMADKRTLIRRASFDLLGLPPTPAEVNAFLTDESADAYVKLIERLLASPQYGERWGRHWLDVVRYADTAGETADYPAPEAYRYRDYVIRSFNADKPYDEFLREQIAGDVFAADMLAAGPLADAEAHERYAEQLTATGYLAISRRFGFDPQNYHHLTLADTIDTLGRSVLGLSLGCARCHDHKYDPVSMGDYYALYGIFDSTRFPFPGSEEQKRPHDLVPELPPAEVDALVKPHQERLAQLKAEVDRLEPERAKAEAELQALVGADGDFESQLADAPPSKPWAMQSGAKMSAAAQSPYANCYPPGKQGVSFPTEAGNTYVAQTFASPRTPKTHDVVYFNIDFRNVASPAAGDGSYRFYLGHGSGASAAVEFFASRDAFVVRNGNGHEVIRPLVEKTWYNVQLTVDLDAKTYSGSVGTPEESVRFSGKAFAPNWDGVLDTFFVDGYGHLPGIKPAHEVDNMALRDEPIAALAAGGQASPLLAPRDEACQLRIRELKAIIEQAAKAVRERDAWAAKAPRIQTLYAMAEGSPHNAKIQKRGEPLQPGAEAPRGFLAILGGDRLPDGAPGSGRRELAEWLARPTNPLTARVMVNRIWQNHFGRGIVPTPSDFGARGQPPSHPQLLDYLAARFMAEGWSIKAVHRAILLSRTYQLSGIADAGQSELDPPNELLSRFPRRRVDAESIRDSILAVSGGLDRTPGGPHPFPPVETWGFTQHAPFKAVYETNHRSVYLMTQRIARHPFLALFDGPDPNSSTAERSLTTTPTQALYMMNDPLVHGEADRLARKLLTEVGDDAARIDAAHQLLFSRPASEAEQQASRQWLDRYLGQLGAVPEGERLTAAWAGYLRTLLASNEFIYVD